MKCRPSSLTRHSQSPGRPPRYRSGYPKRALSAAESCQNMNRKRALAQIQREVVACERCPRLTAHCRQVAIEKRRAYREQDYWGRPVPSFGDPNARVFIGRPGSGRPRSEPHGKDVHRRRIGRFPLRRALRDGFCLPTRGQPPGRWSAIDRLLHHRAGPLRATGPTSPLARNLTPASPISKEK